MRLLAGCEWWFTCGATAAVVGATKQEEWRCCARSVSGTKLGLVAPYAKDGWAFINRPAWSSRLCSLMESCWTRIRSTVADSRKVLRLRSIVQPAKSENN